MDLIKRDIESNANTTVSFNILPQHFNMMSARSVYYMIQDEEDIRAYYWTHIMSLRVSGKMAVTKKLLLPIYLRTSVSL